MGILIKAPTRRQETVPSVAEPRGGPVGRARQFAHPRGGAHHRPAPRTALHVATPLRISGAAARCLRRPRLSRGPGRAAEADQAAAVGGLARRRGGAARGIRAAVDDGPRRRGAGAAAERDRECGQAARLAPRRRNAEPPVQAAGGAGSAQIPRVDADSAERGRARAGRSRRDAEFPGAAVRRSRPAAAARRHQTRAADARRAADPARDAAQRSEPARPRHPRTAPVHRWHQLPHARCGRAGAGNRRRGGSLQGRTRRPAVRPRHFGQDRRPGNPLAAHRAARAVAADRQRPRGQPAGQADSQRAHGRGFQLDHGDDARTRGHAADSGDDAGDGARRTSRA